MNRDYLHKEEKSLIQAYSQLPISVVKGTECELITNDGKKIIDFYLKRGSNLNDLYVVIGPCISQKNYEVKIDFKKRFIEQNPNNIKYFFF